MFLCVKAHSSLLVISPRPFSSVSVSGRLFGGGVGGGVRKKVVGHMLISIQKGLKQFVFYNFRAFYHD